jgi:hypothetical protein
MELDRMASGQVLLALAIAGVSAHLLYWIHGEKSMKAVHAWLWSHVALNAALSLVAIRSGTLGAWQSLAWLSLLNVSFYMPLFTSIVVYRVFFHRLRTFPGPTALSISKLAAAYANVAKNQDARRIWALHKRYGNIVRIGPRELIVLDADAAPLLYGPSSRRTRAPWYDRIKSTTGHESQEFQIFQLRDPAQHAARRKAVWDKAFNIGGLIYPHSPSGSGRLIRRRSLEGFRAIGSRHMQRICRGGWETRRRILVGPGGSAITGI